MPLAIGLHLVLGPAARAEDLATRWVAVTEGVRARWGDSPLDAQGVPVWAHQSGEGPEWAPTPAQGTPEGKGAHQRLWLSVPIPDGPWEEPALYLGGVASAFEVYAEGRKVYASGALVDGGRERVEHLGPALVHLPRAVKGGRVLLRVQSSTHEAGVRRELVVGAPYDLLIRALRPGLGYFALGVFLLVLGVVGALALPFLRARQVLGSLAVFALGTGLLMTGLSLVPHLLWRTGHFWYRAGLIGMAFAIPGLCAFIERAILEGRRPWLRFLAPALYTVAVPLSLAILFVPGGAQRLFGPFIGLALLGTLVCLGMALVEAVRGGVDARIFTAGMAGLLVAGLITSLHVTGVTGNVFGNVLHWGFLALTLALLGIVVRRGAGMMQALAAHSRTLEARQGEVRELAGQMEQGAGALTRAVDALRGSTALQSEGLDRQAVALQETQTTVEEIRQTSRMTAEKAATLAASAAEAERVGREGTAALERSLESLAAIRSAVSQSTQRVAALEARAREIASITDAVKGLADQSNMLALNAAIEAVRSGEHGKGFSVVAREVRNLADQSIDATERIREVLESVGQGIREAVRLSGEGEAQVHQSLEQVRASGEQLRQLAGFVSATSASVRQISAAVTQQDAGTSQIVEAVRGLSEQMESTLAAVRQAETATRSIQGLSESMSETARKVRQTGA